MICYKYNNEKIKNNYENLFCYPNVQRRSKFKKIKQKNKKKNYI